MIFLKKNENIFSNSRYLTELKAIVLLALPVIVSQISVIATGFIDTMMAGHYSNNALAGVAVGSSICFPFIIALSGVMMAVTPITAHLAGAGQMKKAASVAGQALWLGIFMSVILCVFMRHTDPIISMMALPLDVTSIVKGYLEGIAVGIPAVAGYFVLKSFAEGLGKTAPQMIISVFCVFFNYFANDILMHGRYGLPELGGAGCGWASGLTFWVYFVCILIYLFFSRTCRETGFFCGFSFPYVKGLAEIIKLGLPIGGTLFMECSIFACITLFIGVLGPVIVGGHQIALNYSGLVFAIPLSIGMSITIRTGHFIGGGNPAAARFSCITGCTLAMGVSLLTLSCTLFFAEKIVSIYTSDPDLTKVAVSLMKTAALYQVSDALMATSQGALRGYKDAFMTLCLTFLAYWVITLPLGYVLSMTDMIVSPMGAKGFWVSLIVGLTVSGVLLSTRLNRVSRRHVAEKSAVFPERLSTSLLN